jgi:hypothetical protein
MARTVRARSTDPVTSHLAADSVDNVTATQAYILRCLKRPRNDGQLVDAYRAYKTAPRASESGIRSRRAELVDRGLVADTGFRVLLNSGRYSIVWGLANV